MCDAELYEKQQGVQWNIQDYRDASLEGHGRNFQGFEAREGESGGGVYGAAGVWDLETGNG